MQIVSKSELEAYFTAQPQLVFKESRGKCGYGTHFIETTELDGNSIRSYMILNHFDIVEECIIQHNDMSKLSSSGVNTVRIVTQIKDHDVVDILGCRLRISVDSKVDNMAAGNIAAVIDDITGSVTSMGYYSDITKPPVNHHPVTGIEIYGFKVPYWNECIELAKDAALYHQVNRSIGWDIAIFHDGPGLIEGNHDWCKLLWQIPANKGLKSMLHQYV